MRGSRIAVAKARKVAIGEIIADYKQNIGACIYCHTILTLDRIRDLHLVHLLEYSLPGPIDN